jgi:putative ABC transport system permease protein
VYKKYEAIMIKRVAKGNILTPENNGRRIKVVGLLTVGSSSDFDALLIG